MVRQVPSSSVGLLEGIKFSVSNVGRPAYSLCNSTTETTSTNNVSGLDVSSLSGCVPGAELTGECSTRSTTSMDNVNVPTVSFADHCVSQADLTGVAHNAPTNDRVTCDINLSGHLRDAEAQVVRQKQKTDEVAKILDDEIFKIKTHKVRFLKRPFKLILNIAGIKKHSDLS
ncbi:hypothetical protein Tco_1084667 [Tanacetum coccineum]